jgi:CRISPR-associated protein Csy1
VSPPAEPGAYLTELDETEALWLDQGRAQNDEEFCRQLLWGDWQDEISARFGHWLNASIETKGKPMGDTEQTQWKNDLDEELGLFRLELSSVEVESR